MSKCKYCSQKAGLFRSFHSECESKTKISIAFFNLFLENIISRDYKYEDIESTLLFTLEQLWIKSQNGLLLHLENLVSNIRTLSNSNNFTENRIILISNLIVKINDFFGVLITNLEPMSPLNQSQIFYLNGMEYSIEKKGTLIHVIKSDTGHKDFLGQERYLFIQLQLMDYEALKLFEIAKRTVFSNKILQLVKNKTSFNEIELYCDSILNYLVSGNEELKGIQFEVALLFMESMTKTSSINIDHEKLLYSYLSHFNLETQIERNHLRYIKLVKSFVLIDIRNNIYKNRCFIEGEIPILLSPNEKMIWVETRVKCSEKKTKTSFSGHSVGSSFRVAKNISIRAGENHSEKYETTQIEQVGIGNLFFTTKTIYFIFKGGAIKLPIKSILTVKDYYHDLEIIIDRKLNNYFLFSNCDSIFSVNLIKGLSEYDF